MNVDSETKETTCIEREFKSNKSKINEWRILGHYFEVLNNEKVTLKQASEVTDIENQIDFAFLKLYGALVNNDPKNIYYIGKKDKNKDYKIYKEIWI